MHQKLGTVKPESSESTQVPENLHLHQGYESVFFVFLGHCLAKAYGENLRV